MSEVEELTYSTQLSSNYTSIGRRESDGGREGDKTVMFT